MSDPPTKASSPSFIDFIPYDTPVDRPLDDPLSGRALWDKARAQGHGAARILTGGEVDNYYPKIMSYLGGSDENQRRSEWMADDADLKKRYPDNYYKGGGAIASAPAAIAGVGGGFPAIIAGFGTGALKGAAESVNTGWEKYKDMMREGSVWGGGAAVGNLLQDAVPAAMSILRGRPPGSPAAASAVERPQISMSKAATGERPQVDWSKTPARPDVSDLEGPFAEWQGPAASDIPPPYTSATRTPAGSTVPKGVFAPDSAPVPRRDMPELTKALQLKQAREEMLGSANAAKALGTSEAEEAALRAKKAYDNMVGVETQTVELPTDIDMDAFFGGMEDSKLMTRASPEPSTAPRPRPADPTDSWANSQLRDPVTRAEMIKGGANILPVSRPPSTDPSASTWAEIRREMERTAPWDEATNTMQSDVVKGVPRKDLQRQEEIWRDQTAALDWHKEAQMTPARQAARTKMDAGGDPAGEGTARAVYDHNDPRFVNKLAKVPDVEEGAAQEILDSRLNAGLEQNYKEARIGEKEHPDLAKITSRARDMSEITAERLHPFDSEQGFADFLGVNKEGMGIKWVERMLNDPSIGNARAAELRAAFNRIQRDLPQVDVNDLYKHNQWGFDANGKIKLLDYGY